MEDKEKRAKKFYESFLKYTETLFSDFTIRKELNFQSIQNMIKMSYEFVRLDRNHIVHVMQTTERYKNPHVSHSVRSCIIALIIGLQLKLPRHHLIELGIAGLLCNISVINMPEWIYTSSEEGYNMLTSGTDAERELLYVHPIHANKILKALNFPSPICEAVLHHHEFEDGTGFPQQLKGEDICMCGKILAVAGFYEAFSMSHIGGEKCGHNGIVRILKNSGNFNVTVLRALVSSISIYPVGICVLLSNDKRGQVVDIDQENPRFPIVKIFGDELLSEIVKTSDELSIVRPLTGEEIEEAVENRNESDSKTA